MHIVGFTSRLPDHPDTLAHPTRVPLPSEETAADLVAVAGAGQPSATARKWITTAARKIARGTESILLGERRVQPRLRSAAEDYLHFDLSSPPL